MHIIYYSLLTSLLFIYRTTYQNLHQICIGKYYLFSYSFPSLYFHLNQITASSFKRYIFFYWTKKNHNRSHSNPSIIVKNDSIISTTYVDQCASTATTGQNSRSTTSSFKWKLRNKLLNRKSSKRKSIKYVLINVWCCFLLVVLFYILLLCSFIFIGLHIWGLNVTATKVLKLKLYLMRYGKFYSKKFANLCLWKIFI